MLDEKHIDLLAKYFEGTLIPEEQRILIRWRNEDPKNELIFKEYEELWRITENIPDSFSPDPKNAWNNVSERIDDFEANKSELNSNNFVFYLTRVAAVFVIGFVLYFVYELNFKNSINDFSNKVYTENSIRMLTLPDSSLVWLNKNSEIKYPENFDDDERVIVLSGEAYFEIKKDVEKPFIIESASSIVTVLGTSFNYRTSREYQHDLLVVNSGKVKFEDSDNSKNHVILVKGEKVEFDVENKELSKSVNENKNYLSWKTGILAFENETFENIINNLSNYYSQEFRFSNNEIKETRLTVNFDNRKLEDVLNILKLTLDITFQKDSEIIVIK